MTREPRELRLPRRLVPSVAVVDRSSALDEAFASVTEADFRCDEAHAESPQEDLAATLRGQLAALEQQRRQLSKLLEGLS
ncbi:MAG: hypothetical protein AAF266_06970 [Planctomycetota bacterium]